MTDQHPITPPQELVQQWCQEADNQLAAYCTYIATQAARWGADQELEACIEWITGRDWTWTSTQLRAARRPKPPSLKELALAILSQGNRIPTAEEQDTIRRALEQLDD